MPQTVSILIPCHNAQEWVRDAVESALAQTYPDVEIIALDDGSRDGTLDILRKYEDRIQVLATPNRGAPAARDQLVDRSTGAWFQALDADDLLDPDKIQRQMEFVARDPCDLVVAPTRQAGEVVNGPDHEDPWVCLIRGQLGLTVSNLWRRSAVVRAGGWNPIVSRVEDYDLMRRMLATGARVRYFDAALTEHRLVNPGSRFHANLAVSLKAHCDMAVRALDDLRERDALRDEHRLETARFAFRGARNLWTEQRDASLELEALARAVAPEHVAEVAASGRVYGKLYGTLGFAAAQRYALASEAVQARIRDGGS